MLQRSTGGDARFGAGLHVELVHLNGTADPRVLSTRWELVNRTDEPIEVLESWFPHNQFHRPRQAFAPALTLAPRMSIQLVADVTFAAAPREVIENAFLILRARYQDQAWRIFARLRIVCDDAGHPNPVVEALSAHPARISGTS